jgi:hypothetical protein
LLPTGTVSGSSQVNADTITNFDPNVLAYNNSLGVVSGSKVITIGSTAITLGGTAATTISGLTSVTSTGFTGALTGNASTATTASSVAWANISGQRTLTRDNAGLRGDAGAISGFFETSSPTNNYSGAASFQHLIDVRHTNTTNNYAMQIAGSFYDQQLWFRKTNDDNH